MKFATIPLIGQFILFFGCTKPSNYFQFKEDSFFYENKFYSQTIIEKANATFLIKNSVGSVASQDDQELIIRQVIQDKVPLDTANFGNDIVFPAAYAFHRDYLKDEIRKERSLQGGTLVVLVIFYYQGVWQGELIFKYPFYLLSF